MIDAAQGLSVDLSGLRLAMCGSAPVNEATVHDFFHRFQIKLHNTYGTSEMGIITSNLHKEPHAPLGSIGKLIRGIEATPLHNGEGELVVRGEAIAEGYFS